MMLGLPLHPLIVHAVVVFIPLAALGALLVVLSRRLRERYGGLAVLVGVVAAAAGFAALLTGPLLAADLGLTGTAVIARHQALGTWTPWVTLLLAVLLPLHLLARGHADKERRGPLVVVTGGATMLAAVASLVLVALIGEAGATAVWG